MFHVMLVLPALAGLGAIALFLLALPYCVGGVLQLALTALARRRWLIWLPGALCLLGLVWTLMESWGLIPLWVVFLYWGSVLLVLWLIWLVTDRIRGAILKHRAAPPTGRT